MNLTDFAFKDFIVNVKNNSITHKDLNSWYFNQTFDDKEILSEFFFYFYQKNFYPRGGWMSEWRYNGHQFKSIESRLAEAFEKKNKTT